MKEENQNVKEREIAEDQIDFRALLFKYIIHWPWFVGAVLLCLVGAWFYLYWATPIYNISATVLIKDEKKGGGAGLSVYRRPGEYRGAGPVCKISVGGRAGRGRARGHRSHRQTLRAGPQQGPGHLSLYADAAGQVRLQGTDHL